MCRDRLAAVALTAVYASLAMCHATGAVTRPGRLAAGGVLVAQDLLVCALLFARRASRTRSSRGRDRVVALAAFALPLGLQAPETLGLPAVLEVLGLLLALVATATLARNLGLLPAVRGLTTCGVYGIVRHPMYAAYLLLLVACVAGAPSVRNAGLALAATTLLVVRLRAEEAMLGRHAAYRAYCRRVPWRLVPGCY